MGKGDGKTLALLTAAYPREQITVGNFARLFERAVKTAPRGSDYGRRRRCWRRG